VPCLDLLLVLDLTDKVVRVRAVIDGFEKPISRFELERGAVAGRKCKNVLLKFDPALFNERVENAMREKNFIHGIRRTEHDSLKAAVERQRKNG
jgi:hypothetical protein